MGAIIDTYFSPRHTVTNWREVAKLTSPERETSQKPKLASVIVAKLGFCDVSRSREVSFATFFAGKKSKFQKLPENFRNQKKNVHVGKCSHLQLYLYLLYEEKIENLKKLKNRCESIKRRTKKILRKTQDSKHYWELIEGFCESKKIIGKI